MLFVCSTSTVAVSLSECSEMHNNWRDHRSTSREHCSPSHSTDNGPCEMSLVQHQMTSTVTRLGLAIRLQQKETAKLCNAVGDLFPECEYFHGAYNSQAAVRSSSIIVDIELREKCKFSFSASVWPSFHLKMCSHGSSGTSHGSEHWIVPRMYDYGQCVETL